MCDPEEFSAETAGAYFRNRGVIPAGARPETRSLSGGVSNRVVEVRWDSDCLVAKRPLANLAVEDDWPADVDRVHNEASAASAYAATIDDAGLDARVPEVRYENRADHVVAFECAPAGATTWKRELLDGTVDGGVAVTLGRALGAVQRTTADDADLRETFASERPFEQLRLDPYHRTVAERHPDVADAVETETGRVSRVKRTLVHGDYSPKNVLLDRTDAAPPVDGGDAAPADCPDRVVPWVIDFEVAHWGDPAFDAAFMLNHLFIKSLHNHERRSEYVDAALAFWDAYDERVPWDVERATVAELGVLMLARVDGKSPVEYVEEGPVADALRTVAKRTLRNEVETLAAFATAAREAGERL